MGNMLETFSSGGCTPRILETIWKSLHANILVLFFHFLCGMGLACKASFPCMLATIGLKLHFRHIALMKIWGRTKSRDQCTTVPYTYWASTFWNLIHTGENTPQYLTLTGLCLKWASSYILTFYLAYSDILSGILPDIYFDILSDSVSGIGQWAHETVMFGQGLNSGQAPPVQFHVPTFKATVFRRTLPGMLGTWHKNDFQTGSVVLIPFFCSTCMSTVLSTTSKPCHAFTENQKQLLKINCF